MRHYFFDTSALVKLFTIEPGSRRVRDMLRSASATPPSSRLFVCDLVHPEAVAALAQIIDGPHAAQRGIGRFEARTLPAALAGSLNTSERFTITDASGHMNTAAALVWKHRIRAGDALHVAAALWFRRLLPAWAEFHFVSSDHSQKAAATAEGLDVLDPTA